MKENIVVKGQLKGYLSWPIVLSVFLVCGNIALFLVSRVGALVMIPFTVCYIGTAVWIYVYSHKRILGGLVEFSSEYAWIQKQLLTDMVIPYALADEDGRLLWMNRSFQEAIQKKETEKAFFPFFPT